MGGCTVASCEQARATCMTRTLTGTSGYASWTDCSVDQECSLTPDTLVVTSKAHQAGWVAQNRTPNAGCRKNPLHATPIRPQPTLIQHSQLAQLHMMLAAAAPAAVPLATTAAPHNSAIRPTTHKVPLTQTHYRPQSHRPPHLQTSVATEPGFRTMKQLAISGQRNTRCYWYTRHGMLVQRVAQTVFSHTSRTPQGAAGLLSAAAPAAHRGARTTHEDVGRYMDEPAHTQVQIECAEAP